MENICFVVRKRLSKECKIVWFVFNFSFYINYNNYSIRIKRKNLIYKG